MGGCVNRTAVVDTSIQQQAPATPAVPGSRGGGAEQVNDGVMEQSPLDSYSAVAEHRSDDASKRVAGSVGIGLAHSASLTQTTETRLADPLHRKRTLGRQLQRDHELGSAGHTLGMIAELMADLNVPDGIEALEIVTQDPITRDLLGRTDADGIREFQRCETEAHAAQPPYKSHLGRVLQRTPSRVREEMHVRGARLSSHLSKEAEEYPAPEPHAFGGNDACCIM